MAKKSKKSKVGVRPLRDRVLIREVEEETEERTTDAGIIIPETVQDEGGNTKRGEVVAVGEGSREDGELVPVAVEEGNTVLFSWGDQLTIDGVDYHLVSESNILAVVE